jgi:hypothetical protein
MLPFAPITVKVPPEYVALPPDAPMSWSSQPVGKGWVVTVKDIALLSFMLGATDTAMYPETAPDGIVAVMEVSLQELIVIGASLSIAAPPPCVAPKPDPVMTTWLPIDPVVAESPVMEGAGADGVPSET